MRSLMISLVVGVIVVLIIWIGPFHQTTYTEIKLFCRTIEPKYMINDPANAW